MKKIVLLFAIVFSVLTHLAAQTLLNPGFESWTNANQPTSWTISGNAVNFTKNTAQVLEGTSSCLINATATATLSQTVTVTGGNTYTFQVSYYYHTTTGNGVRINCYFRDAAKKAIKMSLDDSLALKGPGGNTAYFPKVTGVWKTYTYDVVAPAGAVSFVFNATVASTSSVSLDKFGFTVNSTPTIYPSKTSLTGFTYSPGAGPSAEQSFSVRASNLTGSLTLTSTGNYEISIGSGTAFSARNPITIVNSAGLISPTTIYVRLKSGLAAGTYAGTVSLTSTGAGTQTVTLVGTVATQPVVITPTPTSLSGFTYNAGSGPSPEKSVAIAGSGLTGNVVVTAPTDYEISAVSGVYSGATTLTLSQTAGTLATTNIYLRLKAGLTSGNYNENLSLSTAGASKTVALTGSVSGLTVSTAALIGFNYMLGIGPSTSQSFSVNCSGLTTVVVVIAPTGYEISDSNGSFTGIDYLILPQTGTFYTIYVRLKAGLSINSYGGNLSVSSATSAGSVAKAITLTGSVGINTDTKNLLGGNIKVYSSGNNLIVEGAESGQKLSVYNSLGIELKSVISNGDKLVMPVKAGSVYLVRLSNRMVKVAL
jgi:hypothetical protein